MKSSGFLDHKLRVGIVFFLFIGFLGYIIKDLALLLCSIINIIFFLGLLIIKRKK